MLFVAAAAASWLYFQDAKANALVFPAIALLWLGLAVYLLLLGLVAEVALRERRTLCTDHPPLVREAR